MRLASICLCLCLASTFVACVDDGPDPVADGVAEAALAASEVPIDRYIPVRFVQLVAPTSAPVSDADLDEQVAGANKVFAAAGLQFYRSATLVRTDAALSVIDGAKYAWPAHPATSPALAFNPTCEFPAPALEEKLQALQRAGTYCARDGEIVVFVVSAAPQSDGSFPWRSNAIVMDAGAMRAQQPRWRVFAHEVGHYLGLPHSFRGNGVANDLGVTNVIDPQTQAAAPLSKYWDQVYKPSDLSPVTAGNQYFASEAQAALVPATSLRPIQGNSVWNHRENGNTVLWTQLAFACRDALHNCPAGHPDGALRILVPRTAQAYSACNTSDQASFEANCPCVTTPAQCDLLFTGDPGMEGLGRVLPDGTYGANIMSYNYVPAYGDDQWGLSASQIAQVRRVMTWDLATSMFPGALGRRPRLGIGDGWQSWKPLGGAITGRAAVVATAAGRLDVVVRGTDNVAYNKVYESGAWWPATGWATLGGSFARPMNVLRRGDYLDVLGLGPSGQAQLKTWDPTVGNWVPAAPSTWTSLGQPFVTEPVATSSSTGRLDVVARTASAVMMRSKNPATGAWEPALGWTNLGMPGASVSASAVPAVASRGAGGLDVVMISGAGAAYNRVRNPDGGWWPASSWAPLGNQAFAETPALLAPDANRLELIGRGTDGHAWAKRWTPAGWSPSTTTWTDLGGSLIGPISMVWSPIPWASGGARLDLVARGAGDELLYKSWSEATGAWFPSQTEWARLAKGIGGDPVIVSSTSALDVVVRGADGQPWIRHRVQPVSIAP